MTRLLARAQALFRRWRRRRREQAFLDENDHRTRQDLVAHRCEEGAPHGREL